MKMLEVDRKLAEEHYAVHKDKPFFNDLVEFITSGPVVAMVWEGEDAVKLVRAMLGALKPLEAQPGTIRGDFTTNVQQNIAHASDAPETADIEITLWFRDGELISSA